MATLKDDDVKGWCKREVLKDDAEQSIRVWIGFFLVIIGGYGACGIPFTEPCFPLSLS